MKDEEEAKSLYYTDLVPSGSGAITEAKQRRREKKGSMKNHFASLELSN